MLWKKKKRVEQAEASRAEQPAQPGAADKPVIYMGVTRYERVTSFLMSLIITIGIVTVALGAIWATNRTWIVRHAPTKVEVLEVIEDVPGGGSPDGELNESLDVPGPERDDVDAAEAFSPEDVISDFPELEQTVKDVVQAVDGAMAVTEQLAVFNDTRRSSLAVGHRGTGRKRALGFGPGEGGGVKRHLRWEIIFPSGQTEQEYAKQLDYFGVELGAIVGNKLYLVSKLSSRRPSVRVRNGGAGEDRLYFSWRGGGRRQADMNLLRRAGVPLTANAVVLQFYPFETEQLLARIELKYAKEHGINDMRLVRKTRFQVVRKGDGYTFEIVKQQYFRQAKRG